MAAAPAIASTSASSASDYLWREIDVAESYLVSSQFTEAADLSRNVLERLMSQSDDPDQEIVDMTESAGMVFVQAQHAIDRSSKILQDLGIIFGHIATVPSSVFLAGLCLQISVGCYLDAQTATESYLGGWLYTSEDEKSCVLSIGQAWDKSLILTPVAYTSVLELYCVEVLAKGLSQLDLALQCAREIDIPTSKKQVILEKIQRFITSDERENSNALAKKSKILGGNAASLPTSLPSNDHVWEQSGINEKVIHFVPKKSDLQLWTRGFNLVSPIFGPLSSWITPDYFACASRGSRITFLPHQKGALGGVASFVIMLALYKGRVRLLRALRACDKVLREYWHVMCIGLVDFWHLAFDVHLNPLAAVQPLPALHGMRR